MHYLREPIHRTLYAFGGFIYSMFQRFHIAVEIRFYSTFEPALSNIPHNPVRLTNSQLKGFQ